MSAVKFKSWISPANTSMVFSMIASISSYVTDQPYLNLKILVRVKCKAVSQPSGCVGIWEVVYVVHREVNQDGGFREGLSQLW